MAVLSTSDTPKQPPGQSRSSSAGRSAHKSKAGCLTCKYRKKKCDESKPVCRDCRRFNKECVWIDHRTMNGTEIESLKARVREKESSRKMRKRIGQPQNAGYALHPLSDLRGSPVGMDPSFSVSSEPRGSISAIVQPHSPFSKLPVIPNTNFNMAPSRSGPVSALDVHPIESDPMNDVLLPFEHLVEPRSSAAVLGFLKELSAFNWNTKLTDANQENAESSLRFESEVSPGRTLPNFNIPSFIEQIQTMSHNFPAHIDSLASSFNATFSPSPRASLSFSPELDQSGLHLYNYYLEVLSQKVSIAPCSQNESNSYQRVFLPLAQKDKGVLYGLLAWAGFHLGGQWMAEGTKYAELALKHLCADISFTEGTQRVEDRRTIINKLAAILILCGAEICRGDVKFWSIYLQWGWKLLRSNGGILNFNNNKEEHWLISNFAYHDLLASSTSERGTYFPNETYYKIFADPDGISSGNLNPLLGVSKPLYKIIGDISSLCFESKQIMDQYYSLSRKVPKQSEATLRSPEETGSLHSFTETTSEVSDHSKVADLLNFISNKAHELEITLNNVKPDSCDLQSLSDSELESQLTIFETFQLSCKLYLRQAILRLNPSALECQILMNDLIKCIDVLIDTPMQASIVFPVFIAGLFTVTESGKAAMRKRFEKLIVDYGPWNVVRVKSLVEKIWEENPHGDRVVDWNTMLNDLNWDLNFA
ncbi:hypothetical protein METBIDRAFT_78300 [Metschnikowia bicuspidata var. bicuspidata NRRL YB-4993]|uniref:Zn(2)-C6 fungal-type domain-containing protein n=1 Tax=Metschnikowia bicuspidata var. bicuspidata NRRL YB-4993 TaxID=869754 RepID=A0A1A0HBM5_9ASCO|nr:hypothetical protein METBIDRAFT_78300 [Metschnikowia bicuspidata var. bicuspidata NRRL YB-4993]OBA21288.1 hypothetical protein METBIDRAFT_78300 [Metschnikowia bicuspidata var. bicuspidata NRRL YB-4993]